MLHSAVRDSRGRCAKERDWISALACSAGQDWPGRSGCVQESVCMNECVCVCVYVRQAFG
jgi:hypothetical protein